MLSYQHGYHAGNFADVIKHFTLARLLDYLTQKEKPFLYLETHAGSGLYDLNDKQAQKTGEWTSGIEILWKNRHTVPKVFSTYLNAISVVNTSHCLRYYPGSPMIATQILRVQDRFVFCERHPAEFKNLTELPQGLAKGIYCEVDGWAQMRATLPPKERRGLIFIDPSYELKTEYRLLPEQVNQAYKRFETGTYCIWYPLVDKKLNARFQQDLLNMGVNSFLKVEFNREPAFKSAGMMGCGLWIINPPYVLERELKEALQVLCKMINPGKSSFRIETGGRCVT